MTGSYPRLSATSRESSCNPQGLAEFYRDLLGLKIVRKDSNNVVDDAALLSGRRAARITNSCSLPSQKLATAPCGSTASRHCATSTAALALKASPSRTALTRGSQSASSCITQVTYRIQPTGSGTRFTYDHTGFSGMEGFIMAKLVLGPVRRKMLDKGLPALLDELDDRGTLPTEVVP